MPDNPQTSTAPAFALGDHRVIALTGRDAAAFAQAQFMNDVTGLAPGQWHWSGWLTPKGRVLALFALLKLADDALWLVLPDADPVAFSAALQRFVFRAKVTIDVRDDLLVQGRFAAPASASGDTFAGDESSGIELDLGATGGARTLRIALAAAVASDDDARSRWAAFDLEHGLPRLAPSQAEHWTPQQLSLERLHAFSVKKGCYPGQEIVARTHFLGQAKRGLALFEADAALADGAEVRGESTALGKLVATADHTGRHLALAVLPFERAAQPLSVESQPLRERPLLDGLAR
ncbi:YgfZ/GcvT domain-containing protein [Lysobacter cavernae]|uniref:YgfZ/GcvT domain-containing protein n=1 Tax=Lysobacter cavernae TaxID=1685901 RepID=A0ABV7RSR2_9GAMM